MAAMQVEEWVARLRAVPGVSKATMDRHLMDYLIHEGHKEAAEAFREEASLSVDVDLETITERRGIRTAMESGEVGMAIEHAERITPDLLHGSNLDLGFHVQQQQLLELIRSGSVEEAIAFAQTELAPRAESTAALLAELERTMLLLAYPDASACPEAALLKQEQRQHIASQLNVAMLAAQSQEKEALLPILLKRLHWSQEDLSQRQRYSYLPIDYELAQLSV